MALSPSELQALLRQAFPDADIEVKDLAGDGDHYAVRIVDASFAGKSRVQQHQQVYAALGGRMGDTLHALALQTEVPASFSSVSHN